MNIILCRCTPCIRCQAAQCSVGFSNRLKFSNFLIGNNAIIHVPLYQLPSGCLALLTIWRSWCTLSQRSMQKEGCYTTLKNKSSKEEVSGTKMLYTNLGIISAGSLHTLNIFSAPWLGVTAEISALAQYTQCSHWDSWPQERWRAVTDGLNWGNMNLFFFLRLYVGFSYSLLLTLWATCKGN